MPSADVPNGKSAAEQNLRCWDVGKERRKRRPVRLERHIVMELAQLVINAVRHLIGKLTVKSQRCGSPSENRNGGARVAKDEAYVREPRERSGEQKAEDDGWYPG